MFGVFGNVVARPDIAPSANAINQTSNLGLRPPDLGFLFIWIVWDNRASVQTDRWYPTTTCNLVDYGTDEWAFAPIGQDVPADIKAMEDIQAATFFMDAAGKAVGRSKQEIFDYCTLNDQYFSSTCVSGVEALGMYSTLLTGTDVLTAYAWACEISGVPPVVDSLACFFDWNKTYNDAGGDYKLDLLNKYKIRMTGSNPVTYKFEERPILDLDGSTDITVNQSQIPQDYQKLYASMRFLIPTSGGTQRFFNLGYTLQMSVDGGGRCYASVKRADGSSVYFNTGSTALKPGTVQKITVDIDVQKNYCRVLVDDVIKANKAFGTGEIQHNGTDWRFGSRAGAGYITTQLYCFECLHHHFSLREGSGTVLTCDDGHTTGTLNTATPADRWVEGLELPIRVMDAAWNMFGDANGKAQEFTDMDLTDNPLVNKNDQYFQNECINKTYAMAAYLKPLVDPDRQKVIDFFCVPTQYWTPAENHVKLTLLDAAASPTNTQTDSDGKAWFLGDTSPEGAIAMDNVFFSDGMVSCLVLAVDPTIGTDSNSFFLALRCTNAQNFIGVCMEEGYFRLYECFQGTYTLLGQIAIPPGYTGNTECQLSIVEGVAKMVCFYKTITGSIPNLTTSGYPAVVARQWNKPRVSFANFNVISMTACCLTDKNGECLTGHNGSEILFEDC